MNSKAAETLPRHLISLEEMVTSLRDGVDGIPPRWTTRSWPEVQFADVHFAAPGSAVVGPLAFQGIVRFTGGKSHLCASDDRRDQEPRWLPDGATSIHAAGIGFHYAWAARHRATWAGLDPRMVMKVAAESGMGGEPGIVSCHDARDEVSGHLLMVLAEEAAIAPHAAQPLIVESVANALACRLLSRSGGGGARSSMASGALGVRAFGQVRAYIEDNVGERITLGDLATVAGISRFHFARRFRLRTGESPMGYVLRSRIDRAKTMLRSGPSKVVDIAMALGFADESHFSRTFRRMVGMSPRGFSGASPREWNGSSFHPPEAGGELPM